MVFFLGVDGGGTGCRAALADARGTIIGQGRAGPANINTDPDEARRNILAAATEAIAGTRARLQGLRVAMGLAGANVSGTVSRLCETGLPFAECHIVTDAVTAARGALGPDDGIVAAIGTGSVFAIQRDGVIRQYGGRGFVLGDEGSGAVLGRTLLAEALRAEDGFVPMSPLLAEILGEFGGGGAIIAFSLSARPADFAALAPRIVGSDDMAARRIFDQATNELRGILITLLAGRNLPVVFVGGLGATYAARMEGMEIRAPRGSALDGAVQMALGLRGH
ncbi:MAG: ATPase [Gemmobacter sp.]|jgi:glucosamine kinase|nr:ATPase [Gemmobacter sp.]